MDKSLELSTRKEDTRDKVVPVVIRFEVVEIKQHFDESIATVNGMFSIANGLKSSENKNQAETIWRAQIVFLVSAFDFFMHEITKFGLGKIFDGVWEPTKKYNNITLDLATLTTALKAGEDSQWFVEFINEQFAKDTMVSYVSVREQMNLLGLDVQALADDTFYQRGSTEKTSDKLKRRLNSLFLKRNVIAHQSDRRHTDAEIMEITEATVREYVDDITKIVENIVKQIDEK